MEQMHHEVIEAVVEYYKDDEELMAQCLAYLHSIRVFSLACCAAIKLQDMGRCPRCGCKLGKCTHKEYHSEVDEPPRYEIITEEYCPECDVKTGVNYD